MTAQKAISGLARNHDHAHCQAAALDRAEAICAAHGARLTPLRRRVLEIVWSSHRPMGAYAILEKLSALSGPAAPPTVYRALDFLLAQGLIHKLESLDAFIGCDRPDDGHASQFLICSQCKDAREIADSGIDRALRDSAAAAGFSLSRSTIELLGLCPACRQA